MGLSVWFLFFHSGLVFAGTVKTDWYRDYLFAFVLCLASLSDFFLIRSGLICVVTVKADWYRGCLFDFFLITSGLVCVVTAKTNLYRGCLSFHWPPVLGDMRYVADCLFIDVLSGEHVDGGQSSCDCRIDRSSADVFAPRLWPLLDGSGLAFRAATHLHTAPAFPMPRFSYVVSVTFFSG